MICEINHLLKKVSLYALVLVTGPGLFSCAFHGAALKDDPLKNSKKVIVEGHRTLYRDGAFPVPGTSIRLIPAGPDALRFAGELAGLRARESLLSALEKAGESVHVVTAGSGRSYDLAGTLHEKTGSAASAIRNGGRRTGRQVMSGSFKAAGTLVKGSLKLSSRVMKKVNKYGVLVDEKISGAGAEVAGRGTKNGLKTARKSLVFARAISRASVNVSKKALRYSRETFVTGYAAVPQKVAVRLGNVRRSIKKNSLIRPFKNENRRRREWSDKMTGTIASVVKNYSKEINVSLRKARAEIQNHRTSGISLAALKSFRWLLKGILYDSIVKPVSQISVSSIGYIGVNSVAFPALLTFQEGKSIASIAAGVSRDTVKTMYDILAPASKSAVTAVFSGMSATGGNLVAGAVGVGGFSLGYTEAALSQIVKVAAKGGGKAGRAVLQYVGAPLAGSGVAVGGSVAGAFAVAGGTGVGAALYVGGETAGAVTYGAGNIASGTVLAAGTAASTAAGTALGVYQISRAVAVPAGYEVGAGLVLGYDTLAHISAQSVLAVSDFSYLALSLEGPRWLMYAVRGQPGDGADSPSSATGMVDN